MSPSPLVPLLCRPRPPVAPVALGPGGTVTWGTFCGEVATLRDTIRSLAPSEWVLNCEDSYHFAVAFCAALSAHRSILLPGNSRPEAVASLATAQRGCLVDGSPPPGFDVTVPLPLPGGTESVETLDIPDVESPWVTLLTSGSTGQPKPVRKSLANLLTEVAALETTWGHLVHDARVVSTVSHQHIYGLLFRVLWPLCTGRPFVRHPLLFPEQVLAEASQEAVLVASPATLNRVARRAPTPYRAIFSSGGALSPEAAADSQQYLGCQPNEIFGSTETGGIGWRNHTAPDAPWTLFPGVRAKVGTDHALFVHSPYVTPSGWVSTGDAVRRLDDQRFVWLGRIDQIVKVAEKRVSLTEVEKRLGQLDWVREATVLPLGPIDKTVLGAVLVLTPEGQAVRDQHGPGRFRLQIRRELRRWLEPAAIPRRYREVADLPVNAQGKRIRVELQSLFGPPRESPLASTLLPAHTGMAEGRPGRTLDKRR